MNRISGRLRTIQERYPREGFPGFVQRIYHGYTRNGGTLTAAAISYYALVSVIPLLLLAITLFGFFLGAERGYKVTMRVIRTWAPTTNTSDIERILHAGKILADINNNKGLTGILGVAVLFWIGSQFFHALEGALNRTWCATGNRPFWKGRLMAFGLMGLCALLLLSIAIVGFSTYLLRKQTIPLIGEQIGTLPVVWSVFGYVFPMSFAIVAFAVVYRYVPTCTVPWPEALAGGCFAGVCWEIARVGFGYYVDYVRLHGSSGIGELYGSLGGIVLLVFWIYYTSNILVIGGEFARSWTQWRKDG